MSSGCRCAFPFSIVMTLVVVFELQGAELALLDEWTPCTASCYPGGTQSKQTWSCLDDTCTHKKNTGIQYRVCNRYISCEECPGYLVFIMDGSASLNGAMATVHDIMNTIVNSFQSRFPRVAFADGIVRWDLLSPTSSDPDGILSELQMYFSASKTYASLSSRLSLAENMLPSDANIPLMVIEFGDGDIDTNSYSKADSLRQRRWRILYVGTTVNANMATVAGGQHNVYNMYNQTERINLLQNITQYFGC